ncbi:MAG: MaoC family dehydratase N-terminal domain-containing protein [Candidatus Binatia bacterium]
MSLTVDRALVGRELDRTTFGPVTVEQIAAYAAAYGDTDPRWAGRGPDPVAPPTFALSLRTDRGMAAHVPVQADRTSLDAGKDIEFGAPVRPGDLLTAVSTLSDIYEKTGRTGRMTFTVFRTTVTNQRGEIVAIIDQKMMFR